MSKILKQCKELFSDIPSLELSERVKLINELKEALHEQSPFKDEPVDCVLWVDGNEVVANDYNPNSVAPTEMELLYHSISKDGYTQPIVTWKGEDRLEVVDGFHRNRVGKEHEDIAARIKGYLPVVIINEATSGKDDRISSTIRHNRARGKHSVDAMSDIVVELKRRNWSNSRISKELGMEEDEILRLCQVTGLHDLFSDNDFSKAWEVEGHITEDDFKELDDDISEYSESVVKVKVVNTSDPKRVFHTYDKWECHKAGFYNSSLPGKSKAECVELYRDFLADLPEFKKGLTGVISEWNNSCEHYLTNFSMNRIAWLGQAACCYHTGIPAEFRSGFGLLTESQQEEANNLALDFLNKWLKSKESESVNMDEAMGGGRQSNIY